MGNKYFKQQSKLDWYTTDVLVTEQQLGIGCLMRVADAVETMSGNYQKIIDDRDYYKRRYEAEQSVSLRLRRSAAALRGRLNRMKKK